MASKNAGLTLEEVTEWSSNGANYGGERDCKAVWRSIKDGEITAGTLFHYASASGWNGSVNIHQNGHRRALLAPTKRKAIRPLDAQHRPVKSASEIWAECSPADASHPYIVAKNGRPDGLRTVPSSYPLAIAATSVCGWLTVPICSLDGTVRTLQFIPPAGDGKKLNLPGASLEDGLFLVGELGDTPAVYVTEGVGQAWACWKATGRPAVACFGASRIRVVTQALLRRCPNLGIVLVSDKGMEGEAERVAKEFNTSFVHMPGVKSKNYDANDYAAEYGADALEILLSKPSEPKRRYKLLTSQELAALPSLRWLVRGVLPSEGLAALYGTSGSGKTFLALDLCASIAEGASWFGFKVNRAPVIYLGLEGEAGLKQRVTAWEKHYRRPSPSTLQFVLQAFDLLNPNDVSEMTEAVSAAKAGGGVIVIDTLNRAAPGVEENSSQDMGRIIEAAAALQRGIGGLVLLVHHAGKDQARGMRGHSSLHAALDAAIEVRRENDARDWRLAKCKDGADLDSIPFALEIVPLGVEDDGTAITSCVVVTASPRAPRPISPQGANQKIVWERLGELLRGASAEFGKGGAPASRPCASLEVAVSVIAPNLPCEQKRRSERTRKAITDLVSNGFLEHHEGWLWVR